MSFKIVVSGDARRDIEDIHNYISEHSGTVIAGNIVDAFEAKIASLGALAERGNYPKELAALGNRDYRELHHKPYRIIFRVEDERVVIYAVVDGRRNMEDFLRRRLSRLD